MFSHSLLIERFKSTIPKLVSDLHKGQCGRIGIVGGSKEYTGAPYFAGISALKVGCDLCYVISSKEAAPIIKSYSPELIVFPMVGHNDNEMDFYSTISKMHSIVIGPGLGRTDAAWSTAKEAIKRGKELNLPIVLDADALFMLNYDYSLIDGYKKCILTPNLMEFKRLYEKILNVKYDDSLESNLELECKAVSNLAKKLNNVTILKKGKNDIISDGGQILCNEIEGSNRRCSGQGDIISGTLGTFAYWTNNYQENNNNNNNNNNHEASNKVSYINPNLLAVYSATTLVKICNRKTFLKKHRSMLTTDIINEIPDVFYNLFDS